MTLSSTLTELPSQPKAEEAGPTQMFVPQQACSDTTDERVRMEATIGYKMVSQQVYTKQYFGVDGAKEDIPPEQSIRWPEITGGSLAHVARKDKSQRTRTQGNANP